jgi:hypothetical protein
VLTYTFRPRSYHDQVVFINGRPAYGRTYLSNKMIPFYHHRHRTDWPHTDPRQRDQPKPVVLLNSDFTDYRSAPDYDCTSLSRWHRTLFILACTILHEVAQAYNFYLGDTDEVCWSKYDVKPELGFAWERAVLECILNPLFQ